MAQAGYTPIQLYFSTTAAAVPLAANLAQGELAINIADGKLYYENSSGVVTLLASAAGASGDVVGPASATDNAVARFDGTTGKLIQNGVVIIGDTGAVTGVTDLTASGSVTLSGGTANGVTYLNGSKVLTSGSALTFDGTKLSVGATSAINNLLTLAAPSTTYTPQVAFQNTTNSQAEAFIGSGSNANNIWVTAGAEPTGDPDASNWATARSTVAAIYRQRAANHIWFTNTGLTAGTAFTPTEQMRLTSTGLGIGTSSPNTKLQVNGGAVIGNGTIGAPASGYQLRITNDNTDYYDFGRNNSTGYFISNASQASPYRGFIWAYGGTAQATLDSAGNLGLGVTPSAWYPSYRALSLGYSSNGMFSGGDVQLGLTQNAHLDSGVIWRYTTSNPASQYTQTNGAHTWRSAASGTAGDAIPFNSAMTLGSNGYLSIGDTSTNFPLTIKANGTNSYAPMLTINPATGTNASYIYMNNGGSGGFFVGRADSTGQHSGTTISAYDSFVWNTGVQNIVFGTNNAERAKIDTSGNFGLGIAPSAWNSIYRVIQVDGASISSSPSYNNIGVGANVFYNAANQPRYIVSDDASFYQQDEGGHYWYTAPTGTAGDLITFTNAMTLDASGNLLVGKTTTSIGDAGFLITNYGSVQSTTATGDYSIFNKTTTTTGKQIEFRSANTGVGYIESTSTATSYNTSSDYRLKNTIAPMTGALAKVALLKPCTYKWNADGSDGEGFIAHELAEVCPQAVSGEKDAVDAEGNIKPQGIDTSFLVATLTAAIQEQQAIIESLKARLDAANL